MDFVNLFALVQVAVVMNFGLVLIGTDNFYKKTRNEFKLYIDSLIGGTIKFAEQQLSNTSSSPLDISLRIKKANTADALHKLKSHANTDNVYSYYLACWGVFAGVYCLAFLFAIAFKGSNIESMMKDILIFMVFEILLFGIISYIILRNEHMPESKARHHIIHLLRHFAKFSVFIIIIAALCFSHPIFRIQNMLISLSILIAYLPLICVVSKLFWRLHIIRVCQKNCWEKANILNSEYNKKL